MSAASTASTAAHSPAQPAGEALDVAGDFGVAEDLGAAGAAIVATEHSLRQHAAEEYRGLIDYLYLLAREESPSLERHDLTLAYLEQRKRGRLLRKAAANLAALINSEPATVRANLINAVNLHQHSPELLDKLHAGTVSRATVHTVAQKLKALRLPSPDRKPDGQPWEPGQLADATTGIEAGKNGLGQALTDLADEGLSTGDFAARAAAEVEAHHPEDSTSRHRSALTRRHVRISGCPDGMGRLELYAAAEKIQAIADRLRAQLPQHTSDTAATGRSRTQQEADLLTELLLHGQLETTGTTTEQDADNRSLKPARSESKPTKPTVFIMTSLQDFLSLGGQPSEEFRGFVAQHYPHLEPYLEPQLLGTPDSGLRAAPTERSRPGASFANTKVLGSQLRPHAEALSALLLKAQLFQLIITDPATGYPVGVGGHYRPPPLVKRLLILRDQHCRYPGCQTPPASCETDHLHPFAESGQTAYANLALWCKEHHTGKTAGWWHVSPAPDDGDGALRITDTATGHEHRSQPMLPLHPDAWADHRRHQDEANAPPF